MLRRPQVAGQHRHDVGRHQRLFVLAANGEDLEQANAIERQLVVVGAVRGQYAHQERRAAHLQDGLL